MEEWMTIQEAMEKLQISRATIYRWSESGKLPIYKKLGKSRIKSQDVYLLLNEEYKPLHSPDK